jgi:hypothetical protein
MNSDGEDDDEDSDWEEDDDEDSDWEEDEQDNNISSIGIDHHPLTKND